MVRLRSFFFIFVVEGKPNYARSRIFFFVRSWVLIGPVITALKPEAGRSIPEQDEVALTSDGGS